jgi:8-oxo-dGTP diphosphatase
MAAQRGLPVHPLTIQEFQTDLQYDSVVAISSLIHVPKGEVPAQIEKIAKLLKPQGLFFVSLIEGEDEGLEDPTGVGKARFSSKWKESEVDRLLSPYFDILENHKIQNKKMDRTFLLRVYSLKKKEERMHPRIGVGVLVEKEDKILLGLRKGSHGASTWALPGGHLEFGESVEECAQRELLEETGLKAISCTLGPWVENVMENGKKHYITLLVTVDQFRGEVELREPDKCSGWEWFSWNALPEPLFAPLASFIQLRRSGC